MSAIFRLMLVISMLCTFSILSAEADCEKHGKPANVSKSSDKECPMVTCIDNCSDCHNICVQTMSYCLKKGGKHADAKHIKLLADCAQVCQLSADFMNRQSSMHPEICKLCADLCDKCAASCEELNDENMKDCIEQCRKCADSCRKMGAHKMES